MRAVVVKDQIKIQVRRMLSVEWTQETQKLLVAMAREAIVSVCDLIPLSSRRESVTHAVFYWRGKAKDILATVERLPARPDQIQQVAPC